MMRRDQKVRARIVTDQTWREDAGKLLTGRGNPGYKTWREELEELYNTPNRVIFWVLGLLVIVTSALLAIVRKKFSWVPIIFIILAVLGDRLAWGGLIPSGGSTFAQGNPASVSAGERPARQKVIRVQIPPNGQLSELVVLPDGHAEWKTPGRVEFVFSNGKTFKSIPEHHNIIKNAPTRFRLRGDPGEAVFTIK